MWELMFSMRHSLPSLQFPSLLHGHDDPRLRGHRLHGVSSEINAFVDVGGIWPVFFDSVSPSSAAIVGVTFTGTLPRTLIGLTVDEAAEFERLDRLPPVDDSGNCLWDFEGDPKTSNE